MSVASLQEDILSKGSEYEGLYFLDTGFGEGPKFESEIGEVFASLDKLAKT